MSLGSTLLSLLAATGVVAGGLLVWQNQRVSGKAQRATVAGTNSSSAAVVSPATPVATNQSGAPRMILAEARQEWSRWLNRPARDPFQVLLPPRRKQAAPETPVSRFQLHAIWLQTGGRFAVIDRAVYGEGDPLAEYRILRINADEVVVRGAERTERITFNSHVPAPRVPSGSGTNLIEQWLGPEKENLF